MRALTGVSSRRSASAAAVRFMKPLVCGTGMGLVVVEVAGGWEAGPAVFAGSRGRRSRSGTSATEGETLRMYVLNTALDPLWYRSGTVVARALVNVIAGGLQAYSPLLFVGRI